MPGRLSLALVAIACLANSATSAPRLLDGKETSPLLGWVSFCEQHTAECAVDSNEPDAVVLTDKVVGVIEAVNRRVNSTIRPMRDEDHWGHVDRWNFPDDGYGDCEDFQLLKRKLLVEAGLPRRALRMTVVIDGTGGGHAVLTLRTTRDDLVLDNQTDAILPWQETGYRFIKRESTHSTGWVFLEPESISLVTAMAK
jgi:predicted transglutaminase-like cysteine proteinase